MPYAKNSVITGAKDSYEIVAFAVDMRTKTVMIEVNISIIGADGIVRGGLQTMALRNMDAYVTDPAWTDQSTPPKPAGFVLEDPNTWAGLSWDQIPKTIDQTRQYFDIAADPALYATLKANLYSNFANAGELPPAADGWAVV